MDAKALLALVVCASFAGLVVVAPGLAQGDTGGTHSEPNDTGGTHSEPNDTGGTHSEPNDTGGSQAGPVSARLV